ncbi:helix-turn-helix transcriptional regulator [Aliikangiella coralliicola]|uniref:HTH luxR-type domain-containing protein n=1 Tax=Aliikangiella coralliicola TaxID=2592383 RepID=A0A545UD78_9GAMM|nr:LuxR family transcriptional regulator [Aliikangiella coralliicola]TQV87419.1 hypothetical protein FLL46_13325 [Aliikangiella coralliicola]
MKTSDSQFSKPQFSDLQFSNSPFWVSEFAAELIRSLNQPDFGQKLFQILKANLTFDSFVIMLYTNESAPEILHDEIKEKNDVFYDIYLGGAFLISPIYSAYKRGDYGFFPIREIVPDDFYNSEYYLSYYSKSGLQDQLIMISQINETKAVAISIGLLSGEFSQDDITMTRQLYPIINAAVNKQWSTLTKQNNDLSNQLQRAFDLFASSVLTERERTVIQKLMQGHSSKSAAKILGISVDTERSYRKSAYGKLNINSQSELFNLLFSCLGYADNELDCDPLVLFLNQ